MAHGTLTTTAPASKSPVSGGVLRAIMRAAGHTAVICVMAASFLPSAFSATPASRPSTVEAVIDMYGAPMRQALSPIFAMQNIPYPPKRMTWIGLKEEKVLLVFAPDMAGKMKQVLSYPIIGASGVSGPKLREGDKQVPEGFYGIMRFRPVVLAHLGLEVGYPNTEDRKHGAQEHRTTLGGDIMIHGHFYSTGCLAMGDPAIEELFVMAHDVGLENIKIIFAPCNLTVREPQLDLKKQPKWVPALYERLRNELRNYPIRTRP
jgi:hypothetical protein